jgi:hypothetical protein
MWSLHVIIGMATSVGFLIGCSATRLPDYSPLPAQQYTHRHTQNGLTVAIHPMTQNTEIEQYFGTDLLVHDILPLFVIVENRNAELSFILRKEEIKMLREDSQRFDTPERSKSIGSANAAEAVGLAGGVLLSLPLLLISVGMESHAAEVRRNFAMKELQQATVAPTESKSGFVYVQLPKPANGPDRWRVQIQVVDPKNKATVTYSYVFDWERRS